MEAVNQTENGFFLFQPGPGGDDQQFIIDRWEDYPSPASVYSWAQHIHPCDKPRALSIYNERASTQNNFELRYRTLLNDTYKWVIDVGKVIWSEDGNFECYQRTRIKDKEPSADEERQVNDEMRSFFENAPVGMHCLNSEGLIIWANQSQLDTLGYTYDEYLNHHITDFLVDPDQSKEVVYLIRNNEQIRNKVIKVYTRDLQHKYLCFSSNTYFENGVFRYTRCFFQEVTALKTSEAKMRESNRVLKLINSISNSLSSNLDLHPLIQTITDASTAVSGAQFGAFYINHKPAGHEEIVLYTTSGCPAGGFVTNPLPHVLPPGSFEKICRLNKAEIHEKANEVCLREMCESMLIIPVKARNGELLGKIFLTHHEENVFTETTEMLVAGIAGHAAVAIDNCRLFEEKKSNEQRFRVLAESIPQMVWTASSDGNLDYCNKRWLEYSGLTIKKSLGSGWLNAVHRADVLKGIRKWKECIENGTPYETEFRIKDGSSGKFRWHLVRALPINDIHGNVAKWFGTCTDIEDQKKNVQAKDDFISIASHELKTPLTSLKAYVQLMERSLQEDGYNDTVSLYMNKTNSHINRLTGLISDLLDISRLQSGKMQFNMTKFNFNTLLNDVADSVQQSSTTHKVEKKGNADIEFYGDKQRIEQVITNYLTNAIKYSPSANTVHLEAVIEKKHVKIMVRDKGIGIAPDKLDKIFDRYFRINDNTKVSGLGIGLYISKEIIKKHGGKTWAESRIGEGTSFYITLPLV